MAYISFWSMRGDSDDDVSNNDGTDTSVTYVPGLQGEMASFNGTTSKTVIADASELKPTGNFTVEFIYRTGSGGTFVLFQTFSQDPDEAGIRSLTVASEFFNQSGDNAGSSPFNKMALLTDDLIHVYAFTYDGSNLQSYQDGVLQKADAYTINAAYDTTNFVRIGCSNNSGTDANFFPGEIGLVGLRDNAEGVAAVKNRFAFLNGFF